jgi:hypothetical protein
MLGLVLLLGLIVLGAPALLIILVALGLIVL